LSLAEFNEEVVDMTFHLLTVSTEFCSYENSCIIVMYLGRHWEELSSCLHGMCRLLRVSWNTSSLRLVLFVTARS